MSFRRAAASDVDSLVDIQQAGSVLALAHVFPQNLHPFPRDAIVRRWFAEIADPGTQVYVFTDDGGRVTGFAATRSDELLHLGRAPATWGSGLASSVHDAVLATFAESDVGPDASAARDRGGSELGAVRGALRGHGPVR